MGSVFRKTATKAMPALAGIAVRKGVRYALWIDGRGKKRSAPITLGRDGTDRIVVTARTYTAKYRDGRGIVCEVATGCRDEAAARSILTDLERRTEKVKGGLITHAEADAIEYRSVPLSSLLAEYLVHLEAEGTSPVHRGNVQRCLNRVANECGFASLADISRDTVEHWMVSNTKAGMGARTRNLHRASVVAFASWCVSTGRLSTNPLTGVPKANEAADPRRKRRALTEDELRRLLSTAMSRPLEEALVIRRGKRKGQLTANVAVEVQQRLERLGHERALIYKTLVLTGLRKGELASITIGQVHLDVAQPYIELHAADEKNGRGSHLPLRVDLVADLRQWLEGKTTKAREIAPEAHNPLAASSAAPFVGARGHRAGRETGAHGGQSRQQMTQLDRSFASMPLFNVPSGLRKIFDRDLVAAGIARMIEIAPNKYKIDKRDDRGYTIDVHALRHTFGTLMSSSGVAPRTAQQAMRHSNINLTMGVYTDPRLLDVAGAVESLPDFPLNTVPLVTESSMPAAPHASGTSSPQFAPAFCTNFWPIWCKPVRSCPEEPQCSETWPPEEDRRKFNSRQTKMPAVIS